MRRADTRCQAVRGRSAFRPDPA